MQLVDPFPKSVVDRSPPPGNRFYVENASAVQWPCASAGNLSEAQERGAEVGSSVGPVPSDTALVAMARAVLRESGWPTMIDDD